MTGIAVSNGYNCGLNWYQSRFQLVFRGLGYNLPGGPRFQLFSIAIETGVYAILRMGYPRTKVKADEVCEKEGPQVSTTRGLDLILRMGFMLS